VGRGGGGMSHPWGLSGPAFLWLYGAGLVVAVGIPALVRTLPAVGSRRLDPPLDANGVAFLAGGSRRVVETSLARRSVSALPRSGCCSPRRRRGESSWPR
jgi:hypothetical protein